MKTLAHLSDIHIKFSSRHQEYREVFSRLYIDLKKQKPDRIIITGDLNHQKVNISPGSIELLSELLINLVKVCPVDLILGNHDVNLQQLEQGDTVSPVFKIAEKLSELSTSKNSKKMFIVNSENKSTIDFQQKAIYLYSQTDFYKIGNDLVYGVFSCVDNKILSLKKKEEGVKYVAIYHGGMYGVRNDNGYVLQGDNLMRPEVFDNFDILMAGDIHQYQIINNRESMAYAGSLLQQGYAEEMDKGYLLWDLDTNTHQRKYILNDYGFAKIVIAKGEDFEERIENIKFSNNKKKTKVYIVWEDYQENHSIEKEKQIARLVKDKHGCEVVRVFFEALEKKGRTDTLVEDSRHGETFLDWLQDYIKNHHPDCEEQEVKDILKLADEIDKELEIEDGQMDIREWEIESMEISNLFSFPEKPVKINLEEMVGLIGIFGKNHSGKSNFVRIMAWILYQSVPNIDATDAKKIVNLYTASNKGYGKIYLKINGERYYIYRQVTTKVTKKGEISNVYVIEYKKMIMDDSGNETWVSEISNKKANEKTEVKKLILDAIGTIDDFTKVTLKTQGGKDDYLSQKQQPKNDLINRYIGLEHFRDRYDYGNKFLNQIIKKQKDLGNIADLEMTVVDCENKIKVLDKEIIELSGKKETEEINMESVNKKILDETKGLKPTPKLEYGEINNESEIQQKIEKEKNDLANYETLISSCELWLSENFKKELPFDENISVEQLTTQYNNEQKEFDKEKASYQKTSDWIANNVKLDPIDVLGYDEHIQTLKVEIKQLQNEMAIARGEKCPTCGTITKQPNPQREEELSGMISEKANLTAFKSSQISESNRIKTHNNNVDIQNLNLQNLKSSLTAKKQKIDGLFQKINLISQSQDIINHNLEVENKTKSLSGYRKSIDICGKNIEFLNSNLNKLKQILEVEPFNRAIREKIQLFEEEKKSFKLVIFNLNQGLITKSGDLRVENNKLQEIKQKFDDVKEAEKTYKKYSIYLQAVHRDGIPAEIIRKKMPVVNSKINSILSSIVDFKIDMQVLPNGDITECFYFSDDKYDALPLDAFGSGSQKFIASVVIQDALHFISKLTKPSLKIIDEGFGTLDDEYTAGIVNILNYLRVKYKHVFVITHRNEIKDFMEHVIEVYSCTDSIPQETLDTNPNAGISNVNIV